MGKLKKRYFTKMAALALVFMLVFSVMPADAFAAAAKDITVYMTVSDKGVIAKTNDGDAMAWKKVTVKDLDGSGDFTYDEALKAAHSAYNKADGYNALSSGWVSSVWGVENNLGSYYFTKNGKATDLVTITKVKNGDYLIVSISQDTVLYADWACIFDKNRTTAKVGQKFSLNLSGFPSMTMNDPIPANNVSIGIWENGKVTSLTKTDKNGKVELTFNKAGTYFVTAFGKARDVIKSTETVSGGYSYWSPFEPTTKDASGKTIWGKTDWSTGDAYIGYTEKDYKDGPYPYEELKWYDLTDYDPDDPFTAGYLMYSGDAIYDCPVIAPCCIVTVDRAAQPMKVGKKVKAVKASKLKKKRVAIKLKSLIKVSKAMGKVTYKVKAANKKSKKALKYKKGKIYIKKNTKKGTYKVRVKVIAAGNSQYKGASKTVTIKIKVK